MKRILKLIIKGYQVVISPCLPPSCRFVPTCSEYAISALDSYSCIRALLKIFYRVLRCNPFHPGGFDPA